MGRIFQTQRERAIAYAAFKELERMLKDDGDMAPGSSFNVSNEEIMVRIAPGTTVFREEGINGDGTIEKKATQNLYGYAVWCLFLKRLNLFHQADYVKRLIKAAWAEAMAGKSVEEELSEIDPDLAVWVEQMKKEKGPTRTEQTPRKIEREGTAHSEIVFPFGPHVRRAS